MLGQDVSSPASMGLEPGPLDDLRRELREKVDAHGLPGYSLCVTRNQVPVLLDTYGLRDIERRTPVELDTLFRQFSMTKAIVSVAAMTFFDEGRFQLDDPIALFLGDAWLPARLDAEMGGGNAATVGAQRSGLHVAAGDGIVCGKAGESEEHQTISNGNAVFIRATRTDKHIDIDPAGVARCRWDDRGLWQGLIIQNLEPTPLNAQVWRATLKAHTGNFVGVSGGRVVADCATPSTWIIQLAQRTKSIASSSEALVAGDILQLQHEASSSWLSVLANPTEDESLGITKDLCLASEFLLEKQTWNQAIVPASGPVTMRQLLTHTSGLNYAGLDLKPVTPLDVMVRPLTERCERNEIETLEAWVNEIAKMPLSCQPGTRFTYGYSTDVLGRVVEVLAEAPLDRVLQDRIFTPLRMSSTSFSVSPEVAKQRLSALYEYHGGLDYGKRELKDDPLSSLWVPPRAAPIFGAGGGVESLRGGLVSSLPDYMRFAHMLQGYGQLDGVQVLRRSTVKLMTEVNHLSFAVGSNSKIWDERGWGLLGSIELPDPSLRDAPSHNPGNYGWGGWASTTFRVNPTAGLAYVFMTNCIGSVNYEELVLERIGESLRGRKARRRGNHLLQQPLLVPGIFAAVLLGTLAMPFLSRIFHANRLALRSPAC